MPADLERLASDSALRALDKQERLVEELRARTGIVLAVSSLVVSLGCFLVSVGAGIYLLLPKVGLMLAVPAAGVTAGLFRVSRRPRRAVSPCGGQPRSCLGSQRRDDSAVERRLLDRVVRARARGGRAGRDPRWYLDLTMAESISPEERPGDTPPPRPEPDPRIGFRPEISRPVIGSPQEWLRRLRRKLGDRAA